MKLPVYVHSRGAIVDAECSWPVLTAWLAARGLFYVCIVAAAMLLPHRAGIIVGGLATAYMGAFVTDGLLPLVLLWAGLLHLPEESTPESHTGTQAHCVSCLAAEVAANLRMLAELKGKSGSPEDDADACHLQACAENVQAMFESITKGSRTFKADQ